MTHEDKKSTCRDSSPASAAENEKTILLQRIAPPADDCQVEDAIRFIQAALAATEGQMGRQYFICPICGGQARAVRAQSDGPIMADCPDCGVQVVE